MSTVNVCETFVSIQGESSYAGLTCFFVRLAGCNLRCRYCDTVYAYGPGEDRAVTELVAEAAAARTALVEITGGEPLLQPGFADLARELCARSGKRVLVETNGSLDISCVPPGAVVVLDVKCPGSGEAERMDPANLARLRPGDEVKFVLSDRRDYEWASGFVSAHAPALAGHEVFFGPAFGRLDSGRLARWMIDDAVPARLQVQLHRWLEIR